VKFTIKKINKIKRVSFLSAKIYLSETYGNNVQGNIDNEA
jgi:hypothetical protein